VFSFLESDWFNITLEVVFLILISYDVKRYFDTKKKEYIINVVLTVAFAIWALYPYYTSYVGWKEEQKTEMLSHCKGDENSTKLCKCMDETTFKNYTYEEYKKLDMNSSEYKEFVKETKEDCLDDSWF